MWQAVELHELRVSIVLAEELHFGRTAERLGLTQPRVSQTIRRLEAKLGGQLFHRTSRAVALTPFGERLLAEIRAPVDQLAGVLRAAETPKAQVAGTLKLALMSPPSGGPRLPDVIAAFEFRHPDCRVSLSHADWREPLGPLRRGEIDLMASRLPINLPDIVVGPLLSREERVVAVARDHPLATRDTVTIEDLGDFQVGHFENELTDMLEALIPSRTPSGRPIPRSSERMRTLPEVFLVVASGAIVHPTVPSLRNYVSHPDVVFVPLVGMPPSETALIWRRGGEDRRIRALADVAREVVALDQNVP